MDQATGLVVAIDGPSGSGKSTVSRAVARRLGLRYLDTGAMYRALTWRVLLSGLDPADAAAVGALADRITITPGTDPEAPTVAVDGVPLGDRIRDQPVTDAVSAVSAVPAVRAHLVARQREIIGSGGIVVEGRDIGTVVAPDAPVKVFLTAAEATRAARRSRDPEYVGGGPRSAAGSADIDPASVDPARVEPAVVDRVHADLTRRDRLDSGRAASPLRPAADAVEVDSTTLPTAQVVDRVIELCRAAAARTGHPRAADGAAVRRADHYPAEPPALRR